MRMLDKIGGGIITETGEIRTCARDWRRRVRAQAHQPYTVMRACGSCGIRARVVDMNADDECLNCVRQAALVGAI